MFQKISTKTKLLTNIAGLIVILIVIGSIVVATYYKSIISLKDLDKKVLLSNHISNALHSLQKERGLSVGYLVSKNSDFTKELLYQRKISDKEIWILKNFLKDRSFYKYKNPIKDFIDIFKDIKSIRDKVDKHAYSFNEVIKKYSSINSFLLTSIVEATKSSHVPDITQDIIIYVNILYMKEYMGIERAKGVEIFSSKVFKLKNIVNFAKIVSLQKQNKIMFLNYAPKDIKNFYYKMMRSDFLAQVAYMQKYILQGKYLKLYIRPKYWYDTMTKQIDIFDKIGNHIKDDTIMDINKELKASERVFAFISALVLLSLIIFVYMVRVLLKLTKNEQRLRLVMDRYIINSITDTRGVIIDASEAFCKISGYNKSELIGSNQNIVRHPDTPKEVFADMWRKIKSGSSWQGKIQNRKKDGSSYWVYTNVEPLYNSNGVIDSYISIRMDITENEILLQKIKDEEQKNAKREKLLQQQHRLAQMGEMLSMIAHQWRQPLSAITATAGSLHVKAKLGKLDKERAVNMADQIKDLSLHLSSTIDDFRGFFKPDKTKKITDYVKILDSVLAIVQISLDDKNIELIKNIGKIEKFETYDNELKQVLLNLIKNSEDALLERDIENPKITIDIDKECLSVSDNAGGVPDDMVENIFDPYFSTKMKKDGTGLGLYMSKIIIQEHCGGKLSVENDDFGARFRMCIGKDTVLEDKS